MTASSILRRFALLALPLLLTACDSADSADSFFLPAQRVEFDFVFEGGSLDPGVLNDVISENAESLIGYIENRGFSVDDVIGATIRDGSAEFRIAQPPFGAGVNGFERVEVRIRTEGATTAGTPVAIGTGFTGTSDTADLEIRANDFTTTVQVGAFEAILQVEPSDDILDETYRVEVGFDVLIEVESGAARPAL